jgi:hypothetical protein
MTRPLTGCQSSKNNNAQEKGMCELAHIVLESVAAPLLSKALRSINGSLSCPALPVALDYVSDQMGAHRVQDRFASTGRAR